VNFVLVAERLLVRSETLDHLRPQSSHHLLIQLHLQLQPVLLQLVAELLRQLLLLVLGQRLAVLQLLVQLEWMQLLLHLEVGVHHHHFLDLQRDNYRQEKEALSYH
jgi:hypothetical protein